MVRQSRARRPTNPAGVLSQFQKDFLEKFPCISHLFRMSSVTTNNNKDMNASTDSKSAGDNKNAPVQDGEAETREFDLQLSDGSVGRVMLTRVNDYAEVQMRIRRAETKPIDASDVIPTATITKTKSKEKEPVESALVAIVADVSGSIFSGHLAAPLVRLVKATAKRALVANAEVLFVPWARQSAAYVLTSHNVDDVLNQFLTVDTVKLRTPAGHNPQSNQAVPEISLGQWSVGTSPSAPFTDPSFYGATSPRTGLARLHEGLKRWRDARGAYPSRLQILFLTDGEFTTSAGANYELSDTFLTYVRSECALLPNPPTLVYLGVKHELASDARRIFNAFDTGHYIHIPSAEALDKEAANLETSRLGQLLEEITLATRRLPLILNGTKVTAELNEAGRAIFNNVQTIEPDSKSAKLITVQKHTSGIDALLLRSELSSATLRVEELRRQYADGKVVDNAADHKSGRVRARVQAEDVTLGGLLKRLPSALTAAGTRSEEATWTRELVYAALRRKNALQQTAAAAAQIDPSVRARMLLAAEQSVKMDGKGRFSAAIAKAILRNEPKLRQFREAVTVTPSDNSTRFAIRVQEEALEDGGKGRQSTLHSIAPTGIAEDEESEFLTLDSWKDLYARGDVRCQAFLLPHRPNEALFHAPSLLRLTSTNTHVAMETYRENVRLLVGVHGYAGLFETPFIGMSSEEKYNVCLPTWSPNLEMAVRYKLRPLLGLLLAGHELAHTSRSIELYVPACLALWRRFKETGSAKTLKDALLLHNAYRHTRRWLGLGNLSGTAARSAHRQLLLHLNGETGRHAFSNCMEPILLLLECAHRLPTAIKRAEAGAVIAAAVAEMAENKKGDVKNGDHKSHSPPSSPSLLPASRGESKSPTRRHPCTPDSEIEVASPDDVNATARAVRDGVWRELTYIGCRSQNAGAAMGKEEDDASIQSSMHERIVKPIAAAVINNADFSALVAKDLTLFAKPVDKWPSETVAGVKAACAADPSIARIITDQLKVVNEDMEFADWMMRVSTTLTPETWTYIDANYDIPCGLAAKLVSLSVAPASQFGDVKGMPASTSAARTIPAESRKPSPADLAFWMAFAAACPSNSTRRTQGRAYETGSALLAVIRDTLASKADAALRNAALADRAKEAIPSHGASPLIIGDHERADLITLAARAHDAKDFSVGFRNIFRAQLEAHRVVFVDANKAGDGTLFDETVDRALSNLFGKRQSLATLRTTSTLLPQDRCGFVNCPHFLQPCQNLMKHLESLGHDLPRTSAHRHFFSGMHLEMRNLLGSKSSISREQFVQVMGNRARTMVSAEMAPQFDKMFSAIFEIVRAHYVS